MLLAVASALSPESARSQDNPAPAVGTDSVVVKAGERYAAGSFRRSLLGNNYRDLWTTPIKVPVLDLGAFAGGLKPLKAGGGKQAKSLRLVTKDSSEYVFRPILKTMLILDEQFKGTIVWSIFRDQGSASHPTGALAAAQMLDATGVIHATPIVAVMPDDSILGEFRKDVGRVLGTIEEYPSTPHDARGFPGAAEIVDSDELLERINKDPENQIDPRAFLTARLMDMLLGDNDRHPGQWKWARVRKDHDAPWEPIPRDRDKVFVSYEGLLLKLARLAQPSLVTFGPTYSPPSALFRNAMEFDRRLLATLDKSVWDSVATTLTRTITDSVIDRAFRAMPTEYAASSRGIARTLKTRRDHLREAADHYYGILWTVADVHATDADDRATILRSADGAVDISLRSGKKDPYFHRRFDARETREIRVYLHGGDDTALIIGDAARSIPVRIIGGNGNNTLVDSSAMGGRKHPTHLYDAGSVRGVKYAPDSAAEKKDPDDALNHYFNRQPWVSAYGELIPPLRDRGAQIRPTVGLHSGRGLGVVTRIGVARYSYGFRRVPYASMVSGEVAYATLTHGLEIGVATDNRFESSAVHVPAEAKMSQLEVVQFRGFGNDVPDVRDHFYDVDQTHWLFHPAVGFALGPESDLSLGPVIRYTVTDSARNQFISQQRPYGFGRFGQAGLQLKLHYDTRDKTEYVDDKTDSIKPRVVVDIAGAGYPAMWDVTSAYEAASAVVSAYFTVPVPKLPVLAFRAGAKKLFGDFPYFDAAFLGGSSSLRIEHRQRFAGDGSLYGTAELRVPVAQFPLVLPLDVGAIGFADAGRVYLDGDSPGGWHTAAGAGFWVGMVNPGNSVNVLFTNRRDRRTLVSIGFAF
jgi:hypothetical protein